MPFVNRFQPAVYKLSHKVGQRQPGVPSARIGQVRFGEFAHSQPFIQFTQREQPAVGGHAQTLEINPQPAIERELKGPVSHPPQSVAFLSGLPVQRAQLCHKSWLRLVQVP
jgi:hypothetical protein